MANSCTKVDAGGNLTRRYSDETWWEKFQLNLDSPLDSGPDLLAAALAANPTQFPARGAPWPEEPLYGLFQDTYAFEKRTSLGSGWFITVNYAPLQPGEPNKEDGDNPLLWPRTYRWDWVEFDEAIQEARNVDAFTGAFGRTALTLGPVVNPAYQEYSEGLFRTVREGVLAIRFNVATLDDISDLENDYSGTCNSDTVRGRGPRRWEYLGVEDGDELTANGIKYRPIVVRCQLRKTTDRKINATGWKAFSADDGVSLTPAMVAEEDASGNLTGQRVPAPEPLFIALNGQFTTTAQVNTWRHLEEVPYGPLIDG